jgi:putative membrane protein
MLTPVFKKNDSKAKMLIGAFSIIVFVAVVLLGRIQIQTKLPFNIHILAAMNAVINTTIAITLVAALFQVKKKNYTLHKKLMLVALQLSILFLISYIIHKLFAGEAVFGDADKDGLLSSAEASAVAGTRSIYLFLLGTHVILAALILPFILFTAYRGLTAEYPLHKKLAKYTWPLWFYVSVTGPIVYYFISPFYR